MGNIDGLSLQLGDLAASVTVSPFKGPSPPYGSHRYGFFLFRQFEGMYGNIKSKRSIIISQELTFFKFFKGKMVDWEPLKTQWEQDNSLTNWNYQAFIFEYNLQLFSSNWHLTQHFEPRV